MAVEISSHGDDAPETGGTSRWPALGPDRQAKITLADGEKVENLAPGLYQIVATTDCRVHVARDGTANGADGRVWATGKDEVRRVPKGGSIACAAV